MNSYLLQLKERQTKGKATRRLRREGLIPAVLYGHGIASRSVSVPYNPFVKVFRDAGESSLVDLAINGETVKALIQDTAIDPMTERFLHVDFRQVVMSEKLKTKIPVLFSGESRAVKELGGILVKSLSEIEVECLPQYLIHEIKVDISPLKEFGNVVRMSDIAPPEGIVFLEKPTVVIVTVTAPRSEAELAALEEKVEEKIEAVEVVKAAKKEEEEGEEAAPPASPEKKQEKK